MNILYYCERMVDIGMDSKDSNQNNLQSKNKIKQSKHKAPETKENLEATQVHKFSSSKQSNDTNQELTKVIDRKALNKKLNKQDAIKAEHRQNLEKRQQANSNTMSEKHHIDGRRTTELPSRRNRKKARPSLESWFKRPTSQTRSEESSNASQKKKVRSRSKTSSKDTGPSNYSLSQYTAKEKSQMILNIILGVLGKLLLIALIILLLGGALVGGIGIGYFANLVADTPPPSREEMAAKINHLEQQSTLYYASGEQIANVRTDIVRSITELDDISPFIIDGLIATEDEHFREHPGVVPKAIIRATIENLLTGSGTGGSTLTQQLVKQQLLTDEVTFFRKANEILLALRVENYFSKDEILTAYLNVASFGRNNNGDNIAGIGKAAEGIFGVKPSEVTLPQAAFLVGLPQAPYNYTPYNQYGHLREDLTDGIDRMHEVLFRMYREQKITKEQYEEAKHYDITKDFLPMVPRQEERQSYLYNTIMKGAIEKLMLMKIQADNLSWQEVYQDDDWYNEYYFEAEKQLQLGGYKVYSTIDREIYDQLQVSAQAYNDQIGVTYDGIYTDPETGHETYYVESVQTGMVVIENATGKVLGFVAGTDFENNQIDHAFGMRRSPGSTIKPLAVYGPAIENNLINPATVVPDTAFIEEYEDGSYWAPTNYGNAISNTNITVRRALLRSDNLPAIRVYNDLIQRGVPIIDYLAQMGFNTVDSYTYEDTQNLAFSIGGVTTGPTVFEETRAFTTFANGGKYIEGYFIERIEDAFGNVIFQQDTPAKDVFSEDTNYLMVDMLRDTLSEGTGRTANENLAFTADWIMKTGISEHSKDIWVLGSTPKVTIGSWIGYDSRYQDYTIDVNDGFGLESVRSQIYWAKIVNDLYNLRPDIFGTEQTFQQPDSVIQQEIVELTGTLPGTTIVNGQTYNLSGPLKSELFKITNPAPPLTSNFLFGATEEEQYSFWSQQASLEYKLRQQQQQQETTTEDDEETTQEASEEVSEDTSSNDQ